MNAQQQFETLQRMKAEMEFGKAKIPKSKTRNKGMS